MDSDEASISSHNYNSIESGSDFKESELHDSPD